MVAHLLGQIDFGAMYDAKGGYGLIFYFIYTVLMTFLVMNMFVSILDDSFHRTQEELREQETTYDILEYIKAILWVRGRKSVSREFQQLQLGISFFCRMLFNT
jgi:hypothetical protein